MDHSIKAAELFLGGCNCAQAVFLAFIDVTGMDRKTAAMVSSPFGRGKKQNMDNCTAIILKF